MVGDSCAGVSHGDKNLSLFIVNRYRHFTFGRCELHCVAEEIVNNFLYFLCIDISIDALSVWEIFESDVLVSCIVGEEHCRVADDLYELCRLRIERLASNVQASEVQKFIHLTKQNLHILIYQRKTLLYVLWKRLLRK